MSIAAATIAAAGSVVGLTTTGFIYGRETAAFIDQAIAQDIVDLAIVSPVIVVSALLVARRGAVTIVSLVLLVRLLSTVERQHPPQEPA
jgi:hypothetical protein